MAFSAVLDANATGMMTGNGNNDGRTSTHPRPRINGSANDDVPTGFPLEFRIIATIAHVIIFLVGFFGNIAVVIVVRRTRSMHTPTYCYLVSLAIADLIVLVSAMPEAIISHHLYMGQWVLGHVGCSLLIFGNFLGINASSISILCFTVERYIGICHPLRAQKICSINRAIKIIIVTWTFAVLYNSPWLGLTLTVTERHDGFEDLERCTFRLDRRQYVGFFMMDIFLFYVFPLLVSIILYARIGMVLHKSLQSDVRKSTRRPTKGIIVTMHHEKDPTSAIAMQPSIRKSSSINHDRVRNIQVVQMLLVVVVLFAVLWLPYRGLLVYNSFATPWKNVWYLLFAKTLVYINSAINPLLYNAMSKRFRTEFARHIFCRYRLGDSSETSNNSFKTAIANSSYRNSFRQSFSKASKNGHFLSPTPSMRSMRGGRQSRTLVSGRASDYNLAVSAGRPSMLSPIRSSRSASPIEPSSALLVKKGDSDED